MNSYLKHCLLILSTIVPLNLLAQTTNLGSITIHDGTKDHILILDGDNGEIKHLVTYKEVIRHIAIDTSSKVLYGLTDHNLFSASLETSDILDEFEYFVTNINTDIKKHTGMALTSYAIPLSVNKNGIALYSDHWGKAYQINLKQKTRKELNQDELEKTITLNEGNATTYEFWDKEKLELITKDKQTNNIISTKSFYTAFTQFEDFSIEHQFSVVEKIPYIYQLMMNYSKFTEFKNPNGLATGRTDYYNIICLYDESKKRILATKKVINSHEIPFTLNFVNSETILYSILACDIKAPEPVVQAKLKSIKPKKLAEWKEEEDRKSSEYMVKHNEYMEKLNNKEEYSTITIYSDPNLTKELLILPKTRNATVYSDQYVLSIGKRQVTLYDINTKQEIWKTDIDF